MRIKVFEVGEALIAADAEYQEPAIRAAIGSPGYSGRDVIADVITEWTDTDRSNISTDDYAVVCEDDGGLLWHGWLTGDQCAEPPPQARRWLTGMSKGDRANAFRGEA